MDEARIVWLCFGVLWSFFFFFFIETEMQRNENLKKEKKLEEGLKVCAHLL